jgi:hypothetical protein
MDILFKGNWLINYDPKEYDYPDILITLAQIQDFFEQNCIIFNSININFNKNGKKNYFFQENYDIFLIFCGIDKEYEKKVIKPCSPAILEPLKKPIKTISLLFPRLESDPRWKSMGLPAGQLFLASNLRVHGFDVSPLPLLLKGQNPPQEAFKTDLAGFSLFEDLVPLLGPILADFRLSCKGIMAAGGPFPTLAPIAAAFHLPQINLILRGEAELALPLILQALNRGDAGAFFRQKGAFWQQPGVMALAGFDRVNRPEEFNALTFDLDFLRPEHFAMGLEMNFSRGCGRGCVFCCRAQGAKFRKLPLGKAGALLEEHRKKIENFKEEWGSPRQEPPPLVKGVFQTKSLICSCASCPPLPKGGERGDPDIADLMNQTPTNGNPRKSREGYKPSPSIERINGRDNRAPAIPFFTLNINDDDILQDPAYAREIFALIKKLDFRIFGLQTSTASLVNRDGGPDPEMLDLVSDPELYAEGRPLLWLGTDAFLSRRAGRLGKKLPPGEKFAALLGEIEKRGLRHFHYWISSDGDSTWEEFIDELALIFGFFRDFPGFGLLAHAPFIVPYPSSRLYSRIAPGDPRLMRKLDLPAPDPRFRYPVVERLETGWPQLNALLRNEKAGGAKGFFDFLKEKDLMAAAQLAYHFLKQEMLQDKESAEITIGAEELLAKILGDLVKKSRKVKGKR